MNDPVLTGDYVPSSMDNGATPGQRIGPYKLLQPLGHGGMGEVWLAEQSDPIRRRVALKLIKAGMDTQQVLSRFQAERQALALMDHANIAKVLDAGRTEGGRPYFVMELVQGIPITQFCDKEKLTIRERLDLFIAACQAVQHAHQKGIIHRDLKPSNILVGIYDGKPVPKVIDFGVAKAISSKLTEHTLVTELGQPIGTPEYMAPEQAEHDNLDIDTRADIYSLGVVLYELLAGSPPFSRKQLKNAAVGEMLRMIREVEPQKPSTKLSTADELPSLAATRKLEPKRLMSTVRGELDWIVMKCLEKERARRYETANGLAVDVQRYLADEPVLAGPPSAAYRVRKFVRRNKGGVIAASAMALLLVGGIGATTWQWRRADEEKVIATSIKDFLLDDLLQFAAASTQSEQRMSGIIVDPDLKVRDLLLRAAQQIEGKFGDQPLVEAEIRGTVGWALVQIGLANQAIPQFERMRAICTRKLGPDHATTIASMSNLAYSLAQVGRYADALNLLEETLALQKSKFGSDHPKTLANMQSLSIRYAEVGRNADALKLNEETLALMKAKLGPDHPYTLWSMSNLAARYGNVGRHTDALKLNEETLALKKAKLGSDHPHTFLSMTDLANSYAALRRHSDALALREETLRLRTRALGKDHPDTLQRMHNLANSYYRLGRYADALRLRTETLNLRETKLGPDHPATIWSMWGLAESLVALDRSAEALPIIDDCLKRAAGTDVHPRLIPNVMDLRLRHFEKINDASGCRATADMWETLGRTDAGSLYEAACMRAVTSTVLEKGAANDASRLAREEADKSMTWLKQAVAAGFTNVEHMKKDKDLDALREREDFKKLVAELEAKVATAKRAAEPAKP